MSSTEDGTDRAAFTFDGFSRPDGRFGVRNRVTVLPSVICSHLVAEEIAASSPSAVATPHDHGCAQLGSDNEQTERTLVGIGLNPNVAGVVVVGLGCEEVQSDGVAAKLESRGVPVRDVSIQDVGGTDECIEVGTSTVEALARDTVQGYSEPATLGDLAVGVVVSDLDDSTVETGNPLVAGLVDRVVAAGGRVIVAGTERFVAHPEETRGVVADEASTELDALLDRHADLPARASGVHAQASGRSFDAATGFLGGYPISSVIEYGAVASTGGVTLVDAPSRFEEAATGLAAAGAQVVVHVTAEGIPAGHPVVPVLKVSGRSETVTALPDDIDVDAQAASADDLVERLVETSGGTPTSAEEHGLTEFAITRVGPSM